MLHEQSSPPVPAFYSIFLNITESPKILRNEGDTYNTPEDLQIQKAYLIIGMYMVCLSTLFLFIFLRYRETPGHPSRMAALESDSNAPPLNVTAFKVVVCLATTFMHIYYGIELGMAFLLTTFAYFCSLKLSTETGALITSVYWSTFTFFRLIAVFYIQKVGAERTIRFHLALIILANFFLMFGELHEWCLWVGATVIGMGMSSIWASMFGYLENYFPVVSFVLNSFFRPVSV